MRYLTLIIDNLPRIIRATLALSVHGNLFYLLITAREVPDPYWALAVLAFSFYFKTGE